MAFKLIRFRLFHSFNCFQSFLFNFSKISEPCLWCYILFVCVRCVQKTPFKMTTKTEAINDVTKWIYPLSSHYIFFSVRSLTTFIILNSHPVWMTQFDYIGELKPNEKILCGVSFDINWKKCSVRLPLFFLQCVIYFSDYSTHTFLTFFSLSLVPLFDIIRSKNGFLFKSHVMCVLIKPDLELCGVCVEHQFHVRAFSSNSSDNALT